VGKSTATGTGKMELKEESEEVAWIDHELHQRQAFVLDQVSLLCINS
jgi:hypothetical protein